MTLSINPVDTFIILLYFVGMVALGIWIGRRQRDLNEYLLAGRDLPWWAVLGSIVATETSTVTFLSVPGYAYAAKGDLRFLQLSLGYVLGRFLIVVLFLPKYFAGELFSAYQVLHQRFGGKTQRAASLLFIVTRTLADGLRLYLTALVVEQVTGLGINASIVFMGAVTVIYTFLGGMRTVVWSDCIQLVLYLAGAVVAGSVIVQELPGGLRQWWDFAQQENKLRLFRFDFDLTDRFTIWAGIVGGTFLTFATHGTDQLMVQRYLCARSQSEAGKALIVSGFFILFQFLLFLLIGISLACYYSVFPADPPFTKSDQVFTRFIVTQLPVGVVGLTIAAVLSAAMSTLSSSLHSSSTAAINDFLLPQVETSSTSDRKRVWLGRGLIALFGVLQVMVAISGQNLSSEVVDNVLKIAGITAGLVLGIFFLGMFSHRADERAAFWGLLGGAAVIVSVAFGTTLAWPWYAAVGSVSTFGIGHIWSLFPKEQAIRSSL